jgi:hypothetical protein
MTTTAIVNHRRTWLPALNLLLAGGAAVLAVVAITSDDVGSTTRPRPSAVAPVEPARAPFTFKDGCGMEIRGNTPC